jgi:acyl carrier protein
MAEDTLTRVQDVLRDVFGDDELSIDRDSTSLDIDGWDSMMHINVIIAVERRFGIKFAAAETNGLRQPGQNLGTFCELVDRKLAAKA